jgi:phage shock protein PspC (stress-responsive transcriptional regulator)
MEPSERSSFIQFLHEVKRSRSDKELGGVCGGLAAHSDIPVWIYRALFITLLMMGVGAVAYIALWICMPVEPVSQTADQVTAQAANPSTAQ